MTPMRTAVVIVAAGSGTRVGAGINKVLLPLAEVPILAHSVRTAMQLDSIRRIVIAIRPDERDEIGRSLSPYLGSHDVWLVDGGAERHDSEWHALQTLAPDVDAGEIDVIAIHDAARPLADRELFESVTRAALEDGAAIPVRAQAQLISRDGTLPGRVVGVQTPQAFRAPELLAAYRQAAADGFRGTDTAACWAEYAGLPVIGVPSSARNFKVTFPEDLAAATKVL